MRHAVARAVSVVLLSFVFVLPVSLRGENQKAKKATPSRGKAVEVTLQTTEGPAVKVKTPIKKESRTPFGSRMGSASDDSKPVETPTFRVMSHPREDHLRRGHTFHGDVRTLPQVPPI